jgi:flagellar biosynthesis GTPase FlhF
MAVEDTDTSSAEDNSTDESISLEDMEITAEELAEIENPSDDISEEEVDTVDDEADTEEDKPEQSDESQKESESQDEDTKTEETQTEEERKAYNKMMAEKRIQEKMARQAQIEQSQKDYIAEAESEEQAAIRQLQVEAYTTKVEGLTNKLTNGYERAIKDFPILSDQSPEIQAEISDAIDAFQAKYVTIDSYGNPREVKADLYQYLQNKADSIERLTQFGARKQVDNKAIEKSKTFTPPSRTPKTPKIDPDLAAFEEEAYK